MVLYGRKSLFMLALFTCLMGLLTARDGAAQIMDISAEAALLFDMTNGSILFEHNATLSCEPASLTKLLTVLTACAHNGEAMRYTVGDEIEMIGDNSSTAHLKKGNELSFEAIVDAVLLSSGNDATYTLAVSVARAHAGKSLTDSEALTYFAGLMNETASGFDCTESSFTTVDGYPASGHYSTAYDLLRIAIQAMNTPMMAKSMARSRAYHVFYSGREVIWETTNLLLKKDGDYFYPCATGMKTGATGEGYSLAASAEKDGVTLIAIVLNAPSDDGRFRDAVMLFEAGFASGN